MMCRKKIKDMENQWKQQKPQTKYSNPKLQERYTYKFLKDETEKLNKNPTIQKEFKKILDLYGLNLDQDIVHIWCNKRNIDYLALIKTRKIVTTIPWQFSSSLPGTPNRKQFLAITVTRSINSAMWKDLWQLFGQKQKEVFSDEVIKQGRPTKISRDIEMRKEYQNRPKSISTKKHLEKIAKKYNVNYTRAERIVKNAKNSSPKKSEREKALDRGKRMFNGS